MAMKSKSLSPFENFTRAIDGLMRVPHSKIKAAMEQEKRARSNAGKSKRGPKPKHSSASDRASDSEN